jgi:hypothetical protein
MVRLSAGQVRNKHLFQKQIQRRLPRNSTALRIFLFLRPSTSVILDCAHLVRPSKQFF